MALTKSEQASPKDKKRLHFSTQHTWKITPRKFVLVDRNPGL